MPIRTVFGFLLFNLLLSQSSAAGDIQIARGKLNVSMIVLASCDVYANSKILSIVADSVIAHVGCPPAFPFQASLTYVAKPGLVTMRGNNDLVFTGSRRIELPRLSSITDSDHAVLTIAY